MNKNQYVLENRQESKRLVLQNQGQNYDLSRELPKAYLKLKDGEKILDAGCGMANISRLILDYYPNLSLQIDAIDKSEIRIKDLESEISNLRLEFPKSSIKFELSDLQSLKRPNDYYDLIVCRFVYQHIPQIIKPVTEELHRVLRPGGRFILIDADGIFYGLGTENKFINRCLHKIESNFPHFEGYICKKIPRILIDAGFKVEEFNHVLVDSFKEEDRQLEHKLWGMRLDQIRPHIEKILGESDFEKFRSEYLEEVASPLNFIYQNKFTFFATKT